MDSKSTQYIGVCRTPLLIMDGVTGDTAAVTRLAALMAPFPAAEGNAYPGLRRFIGPGDTAAAGYARYVLRAAVPVINAAYGADGFDLLEASFSIVTTRPEALAPAQRTPHFDSVDPDYLAVLHYISGTAGSGTAFYRQRATRIERVDATNCATFVSSAKETARCSSTYVGDEDAVYERIGIVDGVADRLIIYPGSLLHSGIIPADATFSDDPAAGRLTGNFFVRIRRRG